MNVVSLKKSLDEAISFNLSNKLFMFRFMDSSGNKVDPRVAEIYASHWTYEKSKLEHIFLNSKNTNTKGIFHKKYIISISRILILVIIYVFILILI